jgi:exonuclease SbcC
VRPHLLELQAFGAFPGDVRVDLDALGESGLVLLAGDTGGGKTTLLDAIGFALYGVVPGERAKAKGDLRSHHAADGDPTWVRLTFTARGQRLRVHRTPEWHRQKSRGQGTVKEQPTALLERWDGATWTPVAQRMDDVGLEVGRLLGMDAGQFFQVVLLPQGRFAAFLQADHKEREKLLKQLFHVDRFETVERWLGERAARAAAAVETARAELDRVASRVAQEADVELPDEPALEWASELAGAAGEVRAQAATAADLLLSRRRAAEEALRAAERLADRQARRRAAELEQQRLVAEQEDVDRAQEELSAAERALPVLVAARAVEARRAERATAEAAARAGRAAVDALGARGEGSAEQLRARAADGRLELGRLEALREVAHRRLAASAAGDAAGREAAELAARCGRWRTGGPSSPPSGRRPSGPSSRPGRPRRRCPPRSRHWPPCGSGSAPPHGWSRRARRHTPPQQRWTRPRRRPTGCRSTRTSSAGAASRR